MGIEATRDRLVVAGGQTGTVFVYSLPGGRLVRRFSTGSGGLVKRAFASLPTVAVAGRRLLVVNSQFDVRGGTPVLPFTVSAVRRP